MCSGKLLSVHRLLLEHFHAFGKAEQEPWLPVFSTSRILNVREYLAISVEGHVHKVHFSFVTLAEKIMSRLKPYQSRKMLGSNLVFRC